MPPRWAKVFACPWSKGKNEGEKLNLIQMDVKSQLFPLKLGKCSCLWRPSGLAEMSGPCSAKPAKSTNRNPGIAKFPLIYFHTNPRTAAGQKPAAEILGRVKFKWNYCHFSHRKSWPRVPGPPQAGAAPSQGQFLPKIPGNFPSSSSFPPCFPDFPTNSSTFRINCIFTKPLHLQGAPIKSLLKELWEWLLPPPTFPKINQDLPWLCLFLSGIWERFIHVNPASSPDTGYGEN